MQDTIFALSTAKGRAGVSIIRVSGPKALFAAKTLVTIEDYIPNKLYLADISYNSELIDKAMIVYFKAPNSFTGEEVVEFHLHGSMAIISMIYEALLDMGIRLAEAGEFSKRSFMNGKMDLTSAEGLADLIDAETKLQHKSAMRHMSGEFERLCTRWREELLKILALFEAYIDFPEEEIPDQVMEQAKSNLSILKESLVKFLDDNRRGERLRSGISMAVLGQPNVGKSTMLNFLAKRDIAITSEIAGTTRDILEAHIDIAGYPIILSDTAGIRDTDDIIEKEGVVRAKNMAKNADIKLIMLDSTSPYLPEYLEKLKDENSILILNKSDLANPAGENNLGMEAVSISLKDEKGLDELFEIITQKAEKLAGIGENISITRLRHRKNIEDAIESIERCKLGEDLVLAAEDIRLAARHLSLLTGIIDVEEVLGEIFSNFCIGK